jgi:hypothetical protein
MAMKEFTAGERLFAADLNDNFDETQLAGNILSGTFNDARIPNLAASKTTTGTFNDARIPNLAATKITSGTFNAARIPNLAASKITSGVLDIARIPNAAKAGIGSNVVQTVKTNTFTTSATGFTAVTGLSVTITPTSATSKILLVGQVMIRSTSSQTTGAMAYRLMRGATSIGIAAADGSRARATASGVGGTGAEFATQTHPISYIDSPNTTSPVTYSVEVHRSAGTTGVNITYDDSNTTGRVRGVSIITAIEVAG